METIKPTEMKKKFREVKLSAANKQRLEVVNQIIREYQAQGYVLTLRQLYYQLVSRDIIPNKLAEYSKLSILLKEGRMGGIVDWDAIEDRLRKPQSAAGWESGKEMIEVYSRHFRLERMLGQPNYIEVWVEKDALSGVLKRVTEVYGIPILVNRGYSSASAMYDSYNRFADAIEDRSQEVVILYLGDYDPSGIDMIRDIDDRIREFMSGGDTDQRFEIIPIALTRAQIDLYNPPPNPAKLTDPRSGQFIAERGSMSWEVDALKPEILNEILTAAIEGLIDPELLEDIREKEEAQKEKLLKIADEWEDEEDE